MMRDRKESAQSKISELLSRATRSTLIPNPEFVENTIVIPPDGGWGWVIVAMAFICNFLIDGVMYTFGLFLDEIGESFNVHPTEIALTTSLMSGFYYVVGPLTCAITNRHGFRIVGIIGGILASLSFLLSTFCTHVYLFLMLMGVLCGLGFNMIYIPCLLIVGFYFEKWRALATAIALCGSSLGVMIFPPIVTSVMADLHWTWKFRIFSGLTLLTSVCAFTFRPIRPVALFDETRKNTLATVDESMYSINPESRPTGTKLMFKTYHNSVFPTTSEYHDESSIYSYSRRTTAEMSPSDQSIGKSSYIYKTDTQSISLSNIYELEDDVIVKPSRKDYCRKIFCCCNKNNCNICKRKKRPEIVESINRPLYRDDIFYTGSIYILPEYSKATVTSGPSAKKSAVSYHLSVTRITTQKDIEETGQCMLCPEAVLRTIVTMLHLKLFKSLTFVMLALSGLFSTAGMYCPYIFIVQRAHDLHLNRDWSNLLLTIIGVANTFGRIMCGVLSWFPKINIIAINYVSLIIAGASVAVSNYLTSLGGQIAFAAVFGFNIATLAVLRSIVVVDLLGLENLTNAFGITSMFFGFGCFIGIPVAGALEHYTGRYDESFIFAGCSLILSGLMFIPLQHISNWETNRKRRVSFRV